jgi:hypothetical protein
MSEMPVSRPSALQHPFRGDVSLLNPMRSSVLFASVETEAGVSHRRKQDRPRRDGGEDEPSR